MIKNKKLSRYTESELLNFSHIGAENIYVYWWCSSRSSFLIALHIFNLI